MWSNFPTKGIHTYIFYQIQKNVGKLHDFHSPKEKSWSEAHSKSLIPLPTPTFLPQKEKKVGTKTSKTLIPGSKTGKQTPKQQQNTLIFPQKAEKSRCPNMRKEIKTSKR